MIARPKISRNEWNAAEIGAFEVGRVAPSCRPEPDAPRDEEALAAARPAAALERGRDVARAVDAEPVLRPQVRAEVRDAQRGLGRTRVIQRRIKVSVPRARAPEKASTLRERSER